jgi:predicted translation initiation factor SUI1
MTDEIVYSTGPDGPGKSKRRKKKSGKTQNVISGIKKDGIVRVRRESKGRGGKTVTVIYGVPMAPQELSSLAARLKKKCGTGGTVKEGTIVIQGDVVDAVMPLLEKEGFTVKRAGG